MCFGFTMDIFLLILITALHMYPSMTISTNNHVRAVSSRDYYQNNPSVVPAKTNWEIGLKEATFQALIREQIPDPGLKSGIYSAQIQGFQNTATPFGDIAVIARGQLYATQQGYHFVQDPYQNDCDDCHNTPHRCDRRQCETLTSPNLENLLALWTVKRIRHRDPKFGHRYELQFTISPMSPAASPHFVARNGRFDYSIPGHVFIVKIKENVGQQTKNNFRFDKEHKSTNNKEFKVLPWPNNADVYNHYSQIRNQQQQNYHHNTPNSILLNTGEYFHPKEKTAATTEQHVYNPGFLIGISPNGYKHIIHDIPLIPPERPYSVPQRHYIPPPPHQHQLQPQEPTKEPVKHLHHHFYIPEVEDIDLDKKVTSPTQQPAQIPTQKFYKTPTYIITTNPETTSPNIIYTSQDTTQAQVAPPLTTDPYYRTTYKYPDTTIPLFHTQTPTYPQTTLVKLYTIPGTSPTQSSTSFNPSPFYIHYSEPDPIYENNQPPTVPTFITQQEPIHSTLQPTVPTFVTIQDQYTTPTVIDYYDDLGHTQATTSTPVTSTTTKLKYPDSINAQLPPPERGADTTVPYVSSTAVTIISTPNSIESTTQPIDKTDSTHSESKATTIHQTTYEDEKITTVDIKPRNKFKTTIPYVETTTFAPTTITTTTSSISDSTKNNQDGVEDDLFAVINVPPRKTNKTTKLTDVDIFGEPKKTTQTSTEHTSTSKKGPSAFDEIFSEFQSQSSTENTNRFLTPHTQLSINVTDALKNTRISKYLKYKRNKTNRLSKFRNNSTLTNTTAATDGGGGGIETKTSQSLITSISFKVNKNNNDNESVVTPASVERLTKGEIDEIHQNKTGYNIYEVQRPNTSTDKSQTFDDVAQTLVNHARIVQYLNTKTTKPTRRSYKNTTNR